MNNDVPLICDPPPGSVWVLACDSDFPDDQTPMLDVEFDMTLSPGKLLRLGPGFSVQLIPGRYEWPDAEYCAA